MSANQVFLIAFAISAIGSFTLAIFSLKLGLKWAKVSDVSIFKAFGLYLWLMVCSKEKTSVDVASPPQQRIEGDRFLACKFLKPKRWDVIVFRYPGDPSVKYVKRLVGLPGEKLEIRDGAIWINGEKQEPPEAIRGIHYSPTIKQNGNVYSGPGSAPVQLKSDEYFVLGDFVDQAADSRMWEQGAPGYPPYAVPKSYITGVAINIYWPIKRWTSFR